MLLSIEDTTLKEIADLIRSEDKSTSPIPVTQFAKRLKNIIDSRVESSDTPDSSLQPLYRIGLLADVHIQYDTDQDGNGKTDWQDACLWYQHLGVSAICIAGDLTRNGFESELDEWKAARDSARGTIPVYSSSGNHESKQSTSLQVTNPSAILPYLDSDTSSSGEPYFSKVINGDIYAFVPVFVGSVQGSSNTFSTETLTWLENLLESHRNQRVFVFQHMIPKPELTGNFGSANGLYSVYPIGTSKADTKAFLDMMAHYKNVIWFSGHSHIKWEFENEFPGLNYTRYNGDGAKMVHLSSTTAPRDFTDGVRTELYAEGQAAVMEVYSDSVVIKGYDLVHKSYISELNLVLNTIPEEIPENDVPDTPAVTLSSISATKTNKTYNVGDSVGTNDIVVTAHYSDGSTSVVSGWTASAIDTSSAGTKTMTISYQGKTTTIQIVVNAVEVPDVPDTPSHEDVDIPITWNLEDINTSTGQTSASTNYAHSQNIPHTSGATYTIKTSKAQSGYPRIKILEFSSSGSVLTASDDLISGSTLMESNYTLQNDNASYIVIRMSAKGVRDTFVADGVITLIKHT